MQFADKWKTLSSFLENRAKQDWKKRNCATLYLSIVDKQIRKDISAQFHFLLFNREMLEDCKMKRVFSGHILTAC